MGNGATVLWMDGNAQDDINSAVYTAPTMCENSLWVIWTKVGQRQMAAN